MLDAYSRWWTPFQADMPELGPKVAVNPEGDYDLSLHTLLTGRRETPAGSADRADDFAGGHGSGAKHPHDFSRPVALDVLRFSAAAARDVEVKRRATTFLPHPKA